MLNVELMNPGIQLIKKGKIVTGNYSQNLQSKDQVSDFLMNVLTRLIEFSNQGSAEGQGESVDLNQPAKDSKASNSVDTGTQEDLTDNKVSVYPSISLVLGKPDPSGVIKIGNEGTQEEKSAQQSDQGPLESLSSGKGVVVGSSLNKEEEINLIQGNSILPDKDQKLVLSLDQSPVDGTYITTQEPKEAKPGSMNPNKQGPAPRLILKGTSNKEEEIINGTDYTVRINREEQPVISSAQSLVDGIPVQAQESKDTKPGSMNPNKQGPAPRLILEESSNKEEGIINGTGYTVQVNREEQPVISSSRFLVDGISIQAKESDEAKSGSMNPNKQALAAGLILEESSNKEKGIIKGTGYTVRVNQGEQPILSSVQSLVDELPVQAQESTDTKPGFMDPTKQALATGVILEESSKKDEGVINDTGYTVRVKRGEQPVLSSAQSLVDELPVQAQESKETKSDSTNPNKQVGVEGVTLKEPHENTENLNFTLEGHLPENILKRFAAKVAQTLIDGTSGKTVNSGEKNSKFKKLMEQSSDKVLVKTEGLSSEIIKEKDTKEKPSSASIEIEKTEGQPLGKENEKQKGLDQLFKSESLNDEKKLFSTKDHEGLGKTFEREVVIDPDLPNSGEVLQGKGNEQTQISQIGLAGGAFGDSISKEKTINEKLNRFDLPPRSFELDFLKDNHFIVKKQSSSSMEIVLEPAGLGKLDIELNLTNDRLYGQIMVNDSAGKGLIEKNLPQLLSELVSEGLQIGGFTVSLKNQGRDQNPIKSRSEYKEPSLVKLVPERIVPVQGNHLIHIII